MQSDYQLIAVPHSYYSAKVRSCLQYKRLPYTELGCNFDLLFNRVLPATNEAKFPVVFCPDGNVLHDSCDIVEQLDIRHPERQATPNSPLLKLVSILLETIADEFLIAPIIYYRWLPEDTREWALGMFRILLTENISDPKLFSQAEEISQLIAGGIQEKVHSLGQDRPEVQEASKKLVIRLCEALEDQLTNQPFLLGDRPCLADMAIMNAIQGHLYMDPCDPSMFIRRHCSRLSMWTMRMNSAAGQADDRELYLPESTSGLLAEIASPFGLLAEKILETVSQTLGNHPSNADLPKSLGSVSANLFDADITYSATPYAAWKLQRLRDAYQALPKADQEQADALLKEAGFLQVCTMPFPHRLKKNISAIQYQ